MTEPDGIQKAEGWLRRPQENRPNRGLGFGFDL